MSRAAKAASTVTRRATRGSAGGVSSPKVKKQEEEPSIKKEEKTPLWYAIEFPPEAQLFGIADMFESEAGRDLHLAGEVAKAVFASADELLLEAPEVVKFDVLAAKV